MYECIDEPNVTDNFKPVFKYYKAKKPPPDLTKVKKVHFDSKSLKIQPNVTKLSDNISDLGLKPVAEWSISKIEEIDGLFLVRNPFTIQGQLIWALRCLKNYARNPPNRTNLDQNKYKPGDKRKASEDISWFETVTKTTDNHVIDKLRWATLGYHHNWDTKVYSDENHTEFPPELSNLSSVIVNAACPTDNYRAEAAIVNYYPMDSTLGGHTDHSEDNMSVPLLSMSIGQSCVFLIGGRTKETQPIAIFLHSGDALIMSGESRHCYHAVPRIVKTCDVPENLTQHHTDWEQHALKTSAETFKDLLVEFDEKDINIGREYLKGHRINLNIRQVY